MAAVPGTFNGDRYKDLRNLIDKPIQDSYKRRGEWDSIMHCRFYEFSTVVVIKLKDSWHSTCRRTDKWSNKEGHWKIVDDRYDFGPKP